MILVAVALLCVASVPLTGGRLTRVMDLPIRGGWMALTSLALQIALTTWAPASPSGLQEVLHLGTYALAAGFIAVNLGISGLPILALGALLNVVAIAANGGVMPASERAMRVAGMSPGDGFANSAPVEDARLPLLGDIIPVPGPWPLGNVVSVGDALIMIGLLVILHRASRASEAATVPVRAAAGTEATATG